MSVSPIAFYIGGTAVRWYPLMLALACLFGEIILLWKVRHAGIPWDTALFWVFALLVGGLGGARFGAWIRDSIMVGKLVDPVAQRGLMSYGAFIGIIVTGVIFIRVEKLSLLKMLDTMTPSTALGFAIVRIGCFFNGCCHGVPTDLPWGVVYSPPSVAWQIFGSTPLHPAQLYASFGNLILFFILLFLERKKTFDGFVFLSWLGMYACLRFVLEIFRAEPRIVFGLSAAQLANLAIGPIAFILFYRQGRRKAYQEKIDQWGAKP
jgi:phosphatidylglycerol:prolipoprotein diacylglycerol transferase